MNLPSRRRWKPIIVDVYHHLMKRLAERWQDNIQVIQDYRNSRFVDWKKIVEVS